MQNLLKCPKRQYVVSQKLIGPLLQYNPKDYGIVNGTPANTNFNSELSRLCFPVSHRLYVQLHNELTAIQSLFLRNGFRTTHCFPRSCSARNFSTSSNSSNKNKSDDNSKSSEDPSDKNRKKPNEMLMVLFSKICFAASIFSFILLINYYLLRNRVLPKDLLQMKPDEFLNEMLIRGEIEEIRVYSHRAQIILHSDAIYRGRLLPFRVFDIRDASDAKNIENMVRSFERNIGIKAEDGIPIRYIHDEKEFTILFLAALSVCLLFLGLRMRNQKFPNPLDFFRQVTKAKFTLVEPFSGKGVRFEDVAGLKEAKVEVMEFVDYLKHPERYKKLGAKVPKGALLLGPPGCGKTLLAKAVATESNVPFLSMNGSEFIEMLGGLGAARVRDLFAEAKKRAPSIIYIDEIDAIGKKRSDQSAEHSNSESERTLNQLLVEMDGMATAVNVIILASTNRAEVLDKALLRPGRFDRHILIDLPTLEERKQIFEYHLKVLSLEGKPEQYVGYLAYLTPGFSGADIANVCNEAALHAARDKKTVVSGSDLLYAIDRTIGGAMKKSNPLTPSTKKVVAYHESGHALVGWLLEHTDALLKVTIVPRTNLSLGFSQYSSTDQKLLTGDDIFQKMCMILGGRVAESIMFNKISTAAEEDLKKVTKMAYKQVQQYGMSSTVGLISFDEEATSMKNRKPYSRKMGNVMDAEVRRIITEAYKTTEKLLTDNKDKLTKLAEALIERETLTYDDVEKLIGPPPFGKKRLIEPAHFIMDNEPQIPAPAPTAS